MLSCMFVLPNGFPITYETIKQNYTTALDAILSRTGYFDVEGVRAGNPIVAPGEITTTYSPAYTYAPSSSVTHDSTVVDTDSDDAESRTDTAVLSDLLGEKERSILPDSIDFFDTVESREPGHVIIGIDESAELVQVPLSRLFNHLVGGSIGTGKSVYLRSLVYQIMLESETRDIPIQIGLADIENNTFPEFNGCKNVMWYASSYVEIEHMTTSLLQEVERRKLLYEDIVGGTPKDIDRFNVMARRTGVEELPMIVVIYDEFSALMHRSQANQKRILADILQLALRARKYGIYLVIAGQSFKADLIDSAVIGQFNFNIAFKVRSPSQSISIIGQTGAQDLIQPGEALAKSKDGQVTHVQTLMLDDDTLFDALQHYKGGNHRTNVPSLVQSIIEYAHHELDDRVRFKEIENHLRENGISRSDVYRALEWLDEHQFVTRGEKNGRVLNMEKAAPYMDA